MLSGTALHAHTHVLPTLDCLGLRWVNLSFSAWTEWFTQRLDAPGGGMVTTANPEIWMQAQKDPLLREVLKRSDACLPDGVGVLWASRILGRPLQARLAGSDTLETILPDLHGSVFLWGGQAGVALRAAEKLRAAGVAVAGAEWGYAEAAQERSIIETIMRSGARLVLLGMGSPKQEYLMARLYAHHPQAWYMGVGGMIDVLAGDQTRAPQGWRRRGLEWVYRSLRQPGRIRRWPRLLGFAGQVLAIKMKGAETASV